MSFPRKRESSTVYPASSADPWIPACAGMTRSPLQLQPQHENIGVVVRVRDVGRVLLAADAGAQHDVARNVVVRLERQIDQPIVLRDADENVRSEARREAERQVAPQRVIDLDR